MVPKVASKPRFAIVGGGNVATALATSLRASNCVIDQIIARSGGASLLRAGKLAQTVDAVAVEAAKVDVQAEIVWFCVPDSHIAKAASTLLRKAEWKGKIALHCSGALTSDELAVLREHGAAVASAHPLMTFVQNSQPTLSGISFALEGDAKAVRIARSIILGIGGRPFSIRKQHKVLYHVWGMFASPMLTALLSTGESVAVAAGVSRRAARGRMLPILRQTVENYARLGAGKSFSGPIARGDLATVEKHLRALREIPEARDIYLALARAALQQLPGKSRNALRKALLTMKALRQ